MDQQILVMRHGYWQDPQFAPVQPWAYTYTSGLPVLNGLAPAPYATQTHGSNMMQSTQIQPSSPTFVPNYDPRFAEAQRSFYPMPGYHGGHEPKFYPGNHFQQASMPQKQHAFYPGSAFPTAPLNGMAPAMHGPQPYFPQHAPPHDMQTRNSQSLDAARRSVPASSHHHSPISPGHIQQPHMIAPSSPRMPRGPPRKPKRSGHAIWVGNIPMGASIESLKDHFSRDATNDIESVFLMAKSNCAFVNYMTEEACLAAVERFNHSLFGSVRLLCRMRRDPAASRRSPMPTESTISSAASSDEKVDEVTDGVTGLGISQTDGSTSPASSPIPLPIKTTPSDRYFVLKSLTKEDLQDSLMKGTWETQSHNQQILHDAFRVAENVYLIFSVNKSGEYFGYARMTSSPFDSAAQQTTTALTSNPSNLQKTPATATAPRGYIIDDPSRGTLFWEAEHSNASSIVSSDGSSSGFTDDEGQNSRSRPFGVEWLSVRRVTFQRTKGLRNEWNSGKEVKVARDGTELETGVGQKVVALFGERVEGT